MIAPDLPIAKSIEDVLNRNSFAQNLAQTILHSTFPTSFTIGLYGEWGSGKTSLLNMILEHVENSGENVVLLGLIHGSVPIRPN